MPEATILPMNTYTAEGQLRTYENESREGKIPVMEVFGPTIQGEGAMIGVKTMFIRMGGCDYRCGKCDSMHAVFPQSVKKHAIWANPTNLAEQVLMEAKESNTKWVTLSGGNPCLWDNLEQTIRVIQDTGMQVAVETQGTVWRDWVGMCDQVTISPKSPGMGERFEQDKFVAFLENLRSNKCQHLSQSVAVKVVVFSAQDLDFVATCINPLLDLTNFPKEWRYLSLGNDLPPVLNVETLNLEEPPEMEELTENMAMSLTDHLMGEFAILLDDYLPDSRLAHWKFLPQLHVLVWHNKTRV